MAPPGPFRAHLRVRREAFPELSDSISTRSGEQGFLSVRWTTLGGIMSIRGKDGA